MENDDVNYTEVDFRPVEDFQFPSLSAYAPLKQGYDDVNIIFANDSEGMSLSSHIVQQIATHYGETPYEIISITDEQRPTNYLKNVRPVKTVRARNLLQKAENLFVFDVAEWMAFNS